MEAIAQGGIEGLAAHVAGNYDFTSGDNLLHRTDGFISLDGSKDLHWEAVDKGSGQFKKIMELAGGNEEESLVLLVGGDEKARQMLADQGVELSGDESPEQLGTLLIETFRDEADPNKLNISHDQLALNRDWQGMYESYTANQSFFDARTWIAGNKDALRAANQGDDVTTKLEYYTLLYEPLKAALSQRFSVSGDTDPLQYLVENTSEVQVDGWNSPLRVHNNIADNLRRALQNTINAGEQIPPHSGGLVIRFQTNTDNRLRLSNHSLGMAFDIDQANNPQRFLDKESVNDPYFTRYIQNTIGVRPKGVSGWEQNRQYAELVNGFSAHLERRKSTVENMINNLSNRGIYAALPTLKAKLQEIETSITKWEGEPEESLWFNMTRTFVNNLIDEGFKWAGDWWYQKDYMHFEAE